MSDRCEHETLAIAGEILLKTCVTTLPLLSFLHRSTCNLLMGGYPVTDQTAVLDLTADIVSAFVSNNSAHATDLPEIIRSVHAALVGITMPKPEATPAEAPTPAVPIRKSVTDDYIISLEDGRKFKSMKRYLAGLGMTPDQYRQKWSLPRDYPMVAPGYAAKRSELAKAVGLGRKQDAAASKAETAVEDEVVAPAEVEAEAAPETPSREDDAPAAAPKRRGRAVKKAA